MKTTIVTILLLIISNVFMTFAWYGHLKLQNTGISKNWPLFVVILVSWGIALLEYCFMIPANRIGYQENGGPFSLFQLKVIQEVITLTVFTIVAMFLFSGEKLHWNHIAAFICLVGAVCFVFLPTGK
ncbi:MAG: DMT family protein [Bacteroides sp.]|nr:DMT family protein [Bacteroides sp.]